MKNNVLCAVWNFKYEYLFQMEIKWFSKEFQLTLKWHILSISVPESNKKILKKKNPATWKDHTVFIGIIQITALLLLLFSCLHRSLSYLQKAQWLFDERGFLIQGYLHLVYKTHAILVGQGSIELWGGRENLLP